MTDQIAKPRFVGLDVHKREITFCIIDAAGAVVSQDKFALDRESLRNFARCKLRSTDQVALESTTNCWAVAGFDLREPTAMIPRVEIGIVGRGFAADDAPSRFLMAICLDMLNSGRPTRCGREPSVSSRARRTDATSDRHGSYQPGIPGSSAR